MLSSLQHILWVVGLVLIQAVFFNHIHIGGYATPFVYVWLILILNKNINRNILLLWGFGIGLLIDIFSNTLGMHAAATTLLAYVRPFILSLFVSHDSQEDFSPGVRVMGIGRFTGYVGIGVLLHYIVLLSLDAFSLFYWHILLAKIFSCALLTVLCILFIEFMRKGK